MITSISTLGLVVGASISLTTAAQVTPGEVSRSMIFEADYGTDSTIVLELEDADFDHVDFDGNLTFHGVITGPDGQEVAVVLDMPEAIIDFGLRSNVATYSSGGSAFAIDARGEWVAVTSHEVVGVSQELRTDFVGSIQNAITTTSVGTFPDLSAKVSGGLAGAPLEVALAQAIGRLLEGVFAVVDDDDRAWPTFSECQEAAKDACGEWGIR
ncbi:MAG: hypothetical protein AAF108_07865 [Planctomycetota bacterium]